MADDVFASMLDGVADGSIPLDKPQEQDPIFTSIVNEAKTAEASRNAQAAQRAQKAMPDQYADHLVLSETFGVPVDFVGRNEKALKEFKGFTDTKRMMDDNPPLAKWYATDDNAQAIKVDELRHMTGLGWLGQAAGASFMDSYRNVNFNDLQYKKMMGTATGDDLASLSKMEAAREPRTYGADTFMQEGWVGAAAQIPVLADTVLGTVRRGVEAATYGGVIALGAGAAGPQVALPEELVTVPAGMAVGYGVGAIAGAYERSSQQMAGGAYYEFSQMRDETGKPLDPDVAKVAAIITGYSGAVLETLSFQKIANTIPGFDSVKNMLTKDAVKAALMRPNVRQALTTFAKNVATTGATETATEVVQEAIQIFAGEAAKTYANEAGDGQFTMTTGGEIAGRLADTFEQTLATMMVLGPALSGTRLGTDLRRSKHATQDLRLIEAINEHAKGNELNERLPEKSKEAVRAITENGPVQHVYISPQAISEFFQTAEQANEFIKAVGLTEEFSESQRLGRDMEVPIENYYVNMAGTEIGAAIKEFVKLSPDSMTAREAADFNEAWEEAQANLAEEHAAGMEQDAGALLGEEQVFEDVKNKAMNAGIVPDQAAQYAKLYSQFFRTMANRSGADPHDLYRQYGFDIKRALPTEAEMKAVDNLDLALEVVRRGKIDPLRKQVDKAAGPSLLEAIIARGGMVDTGGELAAMDIPKRAIRAPVQNEFDSASWTGAPDAPSENEFGVDDVARQMWEEGYFPELEDRPTPDDLLNAIREETSGRPRRSTMYDTTSDPRIQQAEGLVKFADMLDQLGLDPKTMTNDEIRAAIDDAVNRDPNAAALFQPAWHGSPHEFERFSLDAIGTGEGAQAYGWGLYFASRREISEWYRDKLAGRAGLKLGGVEVDTVDPLGKEDEDGEPVLLKELRPLLKWPEGATKMDGSPVPADFFAPGKNTGWLAQALGYELRQISIEIGRLSIDEAIEDRRQSAAATLEAAEDDYDRASAYVHLAVVNALEAKGLEKTKPGKLYKVEVPDADELLDWDAPITAQPAGVREKLKALGVEEIKPPKIADPEVGLLVRQALKMADGDPEQVGEIIDNEASMYARAGRLQKRAGDDPNATPGEWVETAALDHLTALRQNFDMTGQKIYGQLSGKFNVDGNGGDKAASEALRAAGIPGHQYIGHESDSTNYVIYDDSRVEVKEFFQSVPDPAKSIAAWQPDGDVTVPNFADLNGTPDGDALFDAVAAAKSIDEAHLAADKWVFDQGAVHGVEHLTAFDEKGGLMLAGRGGKAFVAFPKHFNLALNGGQVLYATHNHPRDSGLSPADMIATLVSSMAGRQGAGVDMTVTAMGSKGTVVTASPGPALERYDLASYKKVGADIAAAEFAAREFLQELVGNGTVSAEDAGLAHAHLYNYVLHRIGLIDLRSGGVKKLETLGIKPDEIFGENYGHLFNGLRRGGYDLANLRDYDSNRRPGGLGTGGVEPAAGASATGLPAGGLVNPASRGRKGKPADPDQLTLLQQSRGDKRGSIQLAPGRTIINLFDQADLSTFLHESGHFFLEVFRDLAAKQSTDGEQSQIADDWNKVREYLGITDDANISVDAHEKWARSFEAYLFEGKAPSQDIASAFARFRSWLVFVYQSVKKLNAPINDNIRAVMDRLIATDEEIEAARRSPEFRPAFMTQADSGMTDTQWKAYTEQAGRAVDRAKQEIDARLLKEIARETTKEWRDAKRSIRAEVQASLERTPVYRLMAYLRTGEGLPGVPRMHLDKDGIVELMGDGALLRLPRGVPPLYRAKGGVHPDVLAELFGFKSGHEMLTLMMSVPPIGKAVADETALRMRQQYGDLMGDAVARARVAAAAVANDETGELLNAEIEVLIRKGLVTTKVNKADARKLAREIVRGKTVREALRIKLYQNANAKAAADAERAILKGDWTGALAAKKRQLLNHYIAQEAIEAEKDVQAAVTYINKFTGRSQPKGVWRESLDQIANLLERFDFRKSISLTDEQRKASLADWITQQEAAGEIVAIPDVVRENAFRKPYRQMTVDDLMAVRDAVKSIEHIGRRWAKVYGDIEAREFNAKRDEITDAVAKSAPLTKEQTTRNPTRFQGLLNQAKSIEAALLKMESVFDWMDSKDINGPLRRLVWQPIADAEARENDMRLKYVGAFERIMGKLDKKRLNERITIPGVRKTFLRSEIMAVALNMGNASNLDKMLRGEAWTEDTVARITSHLNEAEWQAVQGILDEINSLWPEIAAIQKRLTGVEPPKVEAQKIVTPFGELAGGYYPMIYDPLQSTDIEDRNAAAADRLFENTYLRPETRHGFTKERAQQFTRPIWFDLNGAARHLTAVIHDVTHREAILNAHKLLTNPNVRAAITERYGREIYSQMLPWLQSIAHDAYKDDGLGAVENLFRSIRSRATIMGMGFRITTMITQLAGYSSSLELVGVKHMAGAMKDFTMSPRAMWQEVNAKSGMMRFRSSNLDRDLNDQMKRLTGKEDIVSQAQRFSMWGIGFMDRVVTVPTWTAAYREHLHNMPGDEEGAIAHADKVVRLTQGGGGPKDLAAISRRNELTKLVTMFYSYFSSYYNRQRTWGRDVARKIRTGEGSFASLLARQVFMTIGPALIADLMVGKGPDDDEEWAAWAAKKVAMYPVSAVPIVRDAVGVFDRGFGYSFTPAARVIDETLVQPFMMLSRYIDEDGGNDPDGRKLFKQSLETTGYALGLPVGQAATTIDNVWKAIEDDDFQLRDIVLSRPQK